MTDFITRPNLASYPGVTIKNTGAADLVVQLTNGLITDVIGTPDPVPTKAIAVAYEVAARALRNPDGVESVTTGVDDWKKTIRYANADSLRAGVYLTDDEVAALRGKKGVKRVKSIGLKVPDHGFGC
jgi:hypothetical protein